MGMFSDLMGKIFAHASKSAAPAATSASASMPPPPAAAQTGGVSASADLPSATPEPAALAPVADSVLAPASQSVDVTAILNDLASKNPEHLDWKKSIVDLLKLVGMDSSLSARKELATDLNYSGDESDSATMNVWLHKEVLTKLSENGGKVPAELLG